jgi:hypothetical protein
MISCNNSEENEFCAIQLQVASREL